MWEPCYNGGMKQESKSRTALFIFLGLLIACAVYAANQSETSETPSVTIQSLGNGRVTLDKDL